MSRWATVGAALALVAGMLALGLGWLSCGEREAPPAPAVVRLDGGIVQIPVVVPAAAVDAGVRAAAGTERLAGRVVGEDGKGISGLHVTVETEPAGGGPPSTSDTDADGAFAVAGLARGAYRIRVEGPAIVAAELRRIRVPGVDVAVVVARRVRLTGTVSDLDWPAAGAEVEIGGSGLPAPRTAIAGLDGRFTVDDLPEGTYAVAARRGTRATLRAGVERFGDGPWSDLALTLGPAGLAQGRVLDELSGAPVAGARLVLVPGEAGAGEAAVRRVTSDPDGTWRAAGLTPGSWSVDVEATGYLPPLRRALEIKEDATFTADLTLARGAAISGRVVDAAGAPIAGASIELGGQDEGGRALTVSALGRARRQAWASGSLAAGSSSHRLVASGELGVMLGPVPYPPPRGAVPAAPAGVEPPPLPGGLVSDADGAFRVETIPPGRFLVRAAHPDFAPGESEPVVVREGSLELSGVTVTLRRGVRLTGRVDDERGAPVAGAEVSLRAGGRTLQVTFSDAGGAYALERASGDIVLAASARGYAGAERAISLAEADEGRTVEQAPLVLASAGGQLAGTVSDADRHPLAGAEVIATGAGDRSGHALSDGQGRFVLRGLADGTYRLEVHHADFPPTVLTGVRPQDDDVEIVMQAGGGIRGLVLDAHTAGALRTFQVRAVGPGGAELVRSFANGQLELSPLAPGRWQLTFDSRGYATVVVPVDVPAGRERRGTTVDDLRVELWQGATVAGTVYDEHGETVAGAVVEAGLVKGVTDAQGAFRLLGVAPGDRPVRARHPRSGEGERMVPLRSGDEVLTVEIKLSTD